MTDIDFSLQSKHIIDVVNSYNNIICDVFKTLTIVFHNAAIITIT